jgi:hypothetical protein
MKRWIRASCPSQRIREPKAALTRGLRHLRRRGTYRGGPSRWIVAGANTVDM